MKKYLRKPAEPETFYIGWKPRAGGTWKSIVRLIVIALAVIMYMVVSLLVTHQRSFSRGEFDRNRFTELSGTLVTKPFPAIRSYYGKDVYGNPVVKLIPLVNKGKSGAEALLSNAMRSLPPDSVFSATVSGKLIYHHGYVLMELSEGEESILQLTPLKARDEGHRSGSGVEVLDTVTLRGEIIDPKCYLGVMKPGYGKPHSDCAIRCIAGGIPPLLAVRSAEGHELLCMLRGKSNEAINAEVLPYVGMPVAVTGTLVKMDDWLILQVDPNSGIKR